LSLQQQQQKQQQQKQHMPYLLFCNQANQNLKQTTGYTIKLQKRFRPISAQVNMLNSIHRKFYHNHNLLQPQQQQQQQQQQKQHTTHSHFSNQATPNINGLVTNHLRCVGDG